MSTSPTRNGSARRQEYAKLRELYDRAFRDWIEERRRHDLIAGHLDPGARQETETEANARVPGARLAVRERRDSLMSFLLTSQQANPERRREPLRSRA